MGTSNWQNIPFCIDVLMKIQPKNVLDVGVGFGRWGILIREFCEVWSGRIFPDQWLINIEGIEAYEKSISAYHPYFYNKIHIGDALKIIPSMPDNWDIVIFGDVLEHFERNDAENLLEWATLNSKYVMLNIPLGDVWPQEESYGNIYEKHQSIWMPQDFKRFNPLISRIMLDFKGRPFGIFIFSEEDPDELTSIIFGNMIDSENSDSLENTLLKSELQAIKSSSSYIFISRFEKSFFFQMVRKISLRIISFLGKLKASMKRLIKQM